MTANMIDFYKDLLSIFNLTTTEDGKIFIKSKKGSLPVLLDDKPLVLPTRDNINNMVEIVNGKPEITHHLFHPLRESVIKGENKSLLRLKSIIERTIAYSVAIVGEVLFNIVGEYGKEIDDPDLIEFVRLLTEYKAPGIKTLVD